MTEETFITGMITGGVTAALLGIVPALVVVLILVVLDLATGIWAAMKNKIKIESQKLRKTVTKLLAYLSIIVLAAMIDGALTAFTWNLGSFVAGFIMIVELTSLIENFGRITHNDLFEKLRNAIGHHTENKYNTDEIAKTDNRRSSDDVDSDSDISTDDHLRSNAEE